MIIYPAIDLYQGQAVRLYKGDYAQKTVYSDTPAELARDFVRQGATHLHIVDLEGAKNGTTPNFELIARIKNSSPLFCEIGGGIRTMETVAKYLEAGLDRVILGTAAVTEKDFVKNAVAKFGSSIAVGVDIRDGFVAIKGWTVASTVKALDFCAEMENLGVATLICTDISKDGAMQGTNRELYRTLARQCRLQIIASGGVSTIDDVKALAGLNLYGAIIGKAYYTGAIKLSEAIEVAQ